jgi:flagellar hook-basal body complex protein FliE
MVISMKIDNSLFVASRLSNTLSQTTPKEKSSGFGSILNDLMEASSEASAASREKTAELLTGSLDDLPAYKVTGEKSSIMFELNLTVRNKVIDAYKEVMNTQI